ncbi:MAG: flap endonuclease-1 [Promethearchaeota archaeon]
MGVKLRDLVKPVVKEISLKNLLNKKIAIDAFNSIYQFLATIRQRDGMSLKDFQGNVTSHLEGLYYRTLNLIENDIKPVYVFDGPPHELKLRTINERKQKREQAKHKMEQAQDAEDDKEAAKYAQGSSKLTSEMIDESKELLNFMGVPWVEGVHDGEGESARLIEKGFVWASSSQDYDSLLFGARRLIRNLNISRKRKVKNTTVEVQIEYYTLDRILTHLGISREQLIDMGILIGLDFYEGFKGIGEKTAFKLLKEHGSIEGIMSKKVKIKNIPIEIERELLEQLRDIFLRVQTPKNEVKLKWCFPDEEGIRELLHDRHNFNQKRLDNAIKRLLKKKSQKTQQTSLDSFF